MMSKMTMKWRGVLPSLLHHRSSWRFRIRLVVESLSGGSSSSSRPLLVEVRWKGPRMIMAWPRPRRSIVAIDRTREVEAEERSSLGLVVQWNQEFCRECTIATNQDGVFDPWEISFAVAIVNGLDGGVKDKLSILGSASLNVADFAYENKETQLNIPLLPAGGNNEPSLLHLTIHLSKLEMAQSSKITHGAMVPGSSPTDGGTRTGKGDVSSLKRSILPWRRRKLSFRSSKATVRGVPLLTQDDGEEGGDDINFDHQQMSSSDEYFAVHSCSSSSSSSSAKISPLYLSTRNMRMLIQMQRGDEDSEVPRTSRFEFGDDNFIIGKWTMEEVISRDENMKISSKMLFASIDQRSECAAGESACTVLVAVIANWFQKNRGMMPSQSQLDDLIRYGSSEWRKLCLNEAYQEGFPDKHFDLETVLQAGITPLLLSSSKSFIGFFHPEDNNENYGTYGFLEGAMFFDDMWDEISQAAAENASDENPNIYIVSWNDHLFILKVEPKAYYLIDTLGERLQEGCNRAYILKFDDYTVIQKMGPKEKSVAGESKELRDHQKQPSCTKMDQPVEGAHEEKENDDIIYRGKESCREYIKNFLAAIPIRETYADIKEGKIGATTIHQRLQIEFHYALPPQ